MRLLRIAIVGSGLAAVALLSGAALARVITLPTYVRVIGEPATHVYDRIRTQAALEAMAGAIDDAPASCLSPAPVFSGRPEGSDRPPPETHPKPRVYKPP